MKTSGRTELTGKHGETGVYVDKQADRHSGANQEQMEIIRTDQTNKGSHTAGKALSK